MIQPCRVLWNQLPVSPASCLRILRMVCATPRITHIRGVPTRVRWASEPPCQGGAGKHSAPGRRHATQRQGVAFVAPAAVAAGGLGDLPVPLLPGLNRPPLQPHRAHRSRRANSRAPGTGHAATRNACRHASARRKGCQWPLAPALGCESHAAASLTLP